jgi:hypothetical protein
VVAWQGDNVAFAECKRLKRDRLNDNQGMWLRACLDNHVTLDSFLVVEWDVASGSRAPPPAGVSPAITAAGARLRGRRTTQRRRDLAELVERSLELFDDLRCDRLGGWEVLCVLERFVA